MPAKGPSRSESTPETMRTADVEFAFREHDHAVALTLADLGLLR
jgi:hypothetical protein